jgi:catechol 2,3-dioxygenase-like lactoylglutathione lyase family enzyme
MTTGIKEANVNVLKAHLAINVKDVEKSIEFYKKMFGIEPSKVRTGYAKFDVQTPSLNFTLNQVPFGERGALSHLGVQVGSSEDVAAVKDFWEKQGLIPRDEIQTDCCYALQDKAWVTDPDGNEWEVFVVLEDNLPELSEKTAGCCAPANANVAAAVPADGPACGCEAVPPTEAEGACCETQAAKFGVAVKAETSCCA